MRKNQYLISAIWLKKPQQTSIHNISRMKTESYQDFWQRIHNSAKRRGMLLRVMFELTYRCNFKCGHCYIPPYYKKSRELKTKEVFLILDQLRDEGCFYLGFTGGEPFVRKDIIEILWYAKKCGFELIIYTNGSLISKSMVRELIDIKPNKIDITIPGMSEIIFDRITGVAGSRKKVFDTIERLHASRINLGFKTCVLKDNESEIAAIEDYCHSMAALHRLDAMLSPRLDGSRVPYLFRGSYNQPTNNYAEKYSPDSLKNDPLFKCGSGLTQAAITPKGELKMCVMLDYPKYNILESSLCGSWKRLKKLAMGIQPDENYKCNKCNFQNFCRWCPARAWLYNKTFTSCTIEEYITKDENERCSI